MKTADNIVARLPRFYRATEESSFLYYFASAFAKTISDQEKGLTGIMLSHWVDTASNLELDLLASIVEVTRKRNEADNDFRTRIKRTLVDRKKSGTIEAIRLQLATFLATSEDDIIIIENPLTDMHFEKKVVSGDVWTMISSSISDEKAEIIISIEDGEARDPAIIDLDAKVSLRYNGRLVKGDVLMIHQSGKIELNGVDAASSVTFEEQEEKNKNKNNNNDNNNNNPSAEEMISKRMLIIPRKPSRWQFQEKLTDTLARFDRSKFDENVFFKPIPPTTIKIDWYAKLVAAFEVKIPSEALTKNGLTTEELEAAVNSMKAVGVKAIITLQEEKKGKEMQVL
ncbi:MAG TPA: hypothetical protein VE572_06160 [Nitrososphaeraceae archaeon]|jgi:hypothetical protein|nr:hypothetical protein [Nitrososphaeraceae archaeon]